MKGLSLANIASACGGTYRGSEDARNREITGVAIDSRKIEKDFLFVPIKGARKRRLFAPYPSIRLPGRSILISL